jgi:hypothetical protein
MLTSGARYQRVTTCLVRPRFSGSGAGRLSTGGVMFIAPAPWPWPFACLACSSTAVLELCLFDGWAATPTAKVLVDEFVLLPEDCLSSARPCWLPV